MFIVPGKEENKSHKITINDFKRLKVIGVGGYGKVILVSKISDGKIYAIKI